MDQLARIELDANSAITMSTFWITITLLECGQTLIHGVKRATPPLTKLPTRQVNRLICLNAIRFL